MDFARTLGVKSGDEENTVQYEVYPAAGATSGELEALRVEVLDQLLPYLEGRMWQRDTFQLTPSTSSPPPSQDRTAARRSAAEVPPPRLWGSTCFGDNVEDEWFVTWLLQRLTQTYQGLTARVWDNDGEFLLIEAAYALPRWVKPETAGNRVWLHGGRLHLVPLPSHGQPTLPPAPTLLQALQIVRAEGVPTYAPPAVQSALDQRLAGYPGRDRAMMHRARCVVPLRVAALLAREPQLVAAAVEAFYTRDPDDLKAAARMRHLPPQRLLAAGVAFSRCLYAQLAQQQFQAPRGYPLPAPDAPDRKAAELGMKLTAGLEMVACNRTRFADAGRWAAQAGDADAAAAAAQLPDEQLEGNASWAAFRSSLERRGYFQGSSPGSAQHSELLAKAARRFRAVQAYLASTVALAAPARMVDALLQQEEVREAEFADPGPGDSDAWLEEGAAQLAREVQQREAEFEAAQRRSAAASTPAAAAGGSDPQDVAAQLKAFMGKLSSFEGAETEADRRGGGGGGGGLSSRVFLEELGRSLGLEPPDGGSVSEESSGFYSEPDSSDEDEELQESADSRRQPAPTSTSRPAASAAAAEPAGSSVPVAAGAAAPAGAAGRQAADEEDWETRTATDSDDEALTGAGFMEQYDAVLADQMRGTHMANSFQQQQPASKTTGGPAEAGAAGELQPVNVDLNLVSNLLESYAGQQGLPGPASNLAGLLGITLPDYAAQPPR